MHLHADVQERFITVASSDDRGAVADEAEYEVENGPCVDAVRDGVASVVLDLRTETRWPEWAATARSLGFLSAAAVPADTGGGAQLALNLYGRTPGSFGEVEMRRSFAYVDEAARILRLCLTLAQQADLAEHLSRAMAARASVERAIGVLMAQRQISADEAYAILRAGSQHDGREAAPGCCRRHREPDRPVGEHLVPAGAPGRPVPALARARMRARRPAGKALCGPHRTGNSTGVVQWQEEGGVSARAHEQVRRGRRCRSAAGRLSCSINRCS